MAVYFQTTEMANQPELETKWELSKFFQFGGYFVAAIQTYENNGIFTSFIYDKDGVGYFIRDTRNNKPAGVNFIMSEIIKPLLADVTKLANLDATSVLEVASGTVLEAIPVVEFGTLTDEFEELDEESYFDEFLTGEDLEDIEARGEDLITILPPDLED